MLTLKHLQRALGGNVSNNQLLCPGPGHSAADRSLCIKLDDAAPDGFVVHSFAGDDPIECRDYVRSKAGLEPFRPNGGRRASEADIERALAAVVNKANRPKDRVVVAKYNYTGAGGALLYQVLKYEPKDYRQRRPDGNGGWIWNLDDVRRVLYRLPDLLKYPDGTVFVTEGEKDADRVASLDHCATTVASGKWTEDCVQALAGRDCIVLQDNDDAGAKKALAAAQALRGAAKTIRIVLLPELGGDINDVSDWLDQDPRRAEKFVDICFDVPVWTPPAGVCIAEAMGGERRAGRCQDPKDCSATPLPMPAAPAPSPPPPSPPPPPPSSPPPSPSPSPSAAPELTQLIGERAEHDSGYAVAFALLRVADQLAAIREAITSADNRRTA